MKARYIYNGAKNRFEIVEEEKMEVVKIKQWKDLNGVKNDKYVIVEQLSQIYVRALPDDKTNDASFRIHTKDFTEDQIIKILKSIGFNIEFQKSPLEQMKEEVRKIKSTAINNWMQTDDHYWDGVQHACLATLDVIERIEKDEN